METVLVLKIVLAVVLIVENWLGKTDKVRAGSILELISHAIAGVISVLGYKIEDKK